MVTTPRAVNNSATHRSFERRATVIDDGGGQFGQEEFTEDVGRVLTWVAPVRLRHLSLRQLWKFEDEDSFIHNCNEHLYPPMPAAKVSNRATVENKRNSRHPRHTNTTETSEIGNNVPQTLAYAKTYESTPTSRPELTVLAS